MSHLSLNLILASLILTIPQILAALPWINAVDGRPFRRWIIDAKVLGYIGGAIIAVTAGLDWYMSTVGDVTELERFGRYWGALFHAQLIADFIILAPLVLLWIWPKGGAVAVAAYRESLRQPMFWLIVGLAAILILISMVIPYFTLGDDYKLMKQVGFDAVMLFSGLFGLLTASISVNDEIEGRTAITVISKPVSRRQFFIGKYLGILLACFTMSLMLGWVLNLGTVLEASLRSSRRCRRYDAVRSVTLGKAEIRRGRADRRRLGLGTGNGQLVRDTDGPSPGHRPHLRPSDDPLAICTALATRLQFVVNLVICLGVFLIGNLSPIMVHVTDKPENAANPALQLVRFIAQLFNAIFPSLDAFDMGPAIIRDTPLLTVTGFVATVLLYVLLYTGVAILVESFCLKIAI